HWQEGDAAAARDLLDSCRWDFRDWEHAYLRRLFTETHLTLRGHTNGVTSLDFSPDGKRLASTGFDGTLRVWDAATGRSVFIPKTGLFGGALFTPDGKRLVCQGWPPEVKVWDAATGQPRFSWKAPGEDLLGIGVSPDGKRFATWGKDKTVKVWD